MEKIYAHLWLKHSLNTLSTNLQIVLIRRSAFVFFVNINATSAVILQQSNHSHNIILQNPMAMYMKMSTLIITCLAVVIHTIIVHPLFVLLLPRHMPLMCTNWPNLIMHIIYLILVNIVYHYTDTCRDSLSSSTWLSVTYRNIKQLKIIQVLRRSFLQMLKICWVLKLVSSVWK